MNHKIKPYAEHKKTEDKDIAQAWNSKHAIPLEQENFMS